MLKKIKNLISKHLHNLLTAESAVCRSVNIRHVCWLIVVCAASGLIVLAGGGTAAVPPASTLHFGINSANNFVSIRNTSSSGGLGLIVRASPSAAGGVALWGIGS